MYISILSILLQIRLSLDYSSHILPDNYNHWHPGSCGHNVHAARTDLADSISYCILWQLTIEPTFW